MFNRINLRFPRFTLRTLLFFLFSLAILALLVEGGYYYLKISRTFSPSRIPETKIESLQKEYPAEKYKDSEKYKFYGVRIQPDGTVGLGGEIKNINLGERKIVVSVDDKEDIELVIPLNAPIIMAGIFQDKLDGSRTYTEWKMAGLGDLEIGQTIGITLEKEKNDYSIVSILVPAFTTFR